MLKSMTAYGRADSTTPTGHFVIEIQSVNRKFLEVNVLLPRELSQFDIEIKKWLLPHLARGQVTVKVTAFFETSLPFVIKPNMPLARQIKQAWEQIGKELGIQQPFDFSLLSHTEGLLGYDDNREEEENYRQILKQVLEKALQSFLNMKRQEGAMLQLDITDRLEKIRMSLKLIEEKAPYAPKKFREKLIGRIEEILPGRIENEERILREIALYAEKVDIAEEITRFHCHLTHFEELIQSTLLSVGKTLEFVLQELNREVNTMGNKSSDMDIARAVIDIKSELERIREQIQNIE